MRSALGNEMREQRHGMRLDALPRHLVRGGACPNAVDERDLGLIVQTPRYTQIGLAPNQKQLVIPQNNRGLPTCNLKLAGNGFTGRDREFSRLDFHRAELLAR